MWILFSFSESGIRSCLKAYPRKHIFKDDLQKKKIKIIIIIPPSHTSVRFEGKEKMGSKCLDQRLESSFYFRLATHVQYDFCNDLIIGFPDTRSWCLPEECWLTTESTPFSFCPVLFRGWVCVANTCALLENLVLFKLHTAKYINKTTSTFV